VRLPGERAQSGTQVRDPLAYNSRTPNFLPPIRLEMASCAILTTVHPVVAPIHARTPLMPGPDMLARWLDLVPLTASDLS
jgi:putative SOS response-associated peptidase YedK